MVVAKGWGRGKWVVLLSVVFQFCKKKSSGDWLHNNVTIINITEHLKIVKLGNSLAVQWLGLCTFTAEFGGSVPGQGTKITQTAWCGKKKKKIMKLVNFVTYILPQLKNVLGASLVAQWLRICLPMQGTRVRALVWEDPTCRGATRPVSHNDWACASGACAPQQERPR